MISIITKLEPRFEKRKTILANELEEFNEITFITTGGIACGFDINGKKIYSIQKHDKCVVGAYEVSYKKRSAFIYTAITPIHGFFVRRNNWFEILKVNSHVTQIFLRNILFNYMITILYKMMARKKIAMKHWIEREDIQDIKSLMPI